MGGGLTACGELFPADSFAEYERADACCEERREEREDGRIWEREVVEGEVDPEQSEKPVIRE